jgi:hypothetical protein
MSVFAVLDYIYAHVYVVFDWRNERVNAMADNGRACLG